MTFKLKKTTCETKMERQEKAEKTFDALGMGRLSHSAFRAEWEAQLEELEEAGVDRLSEDCLKWKCLRKLTPELRGAVMRNVYPLDDGGPPRRPDTWKEIADCVEMELEI